MPKFSTDASKSKSVLGKRSRDGDKKDNQSSKAEAPNDKSTELFTKRLQKSKLKELSKSLGDAIRNGQDASRIKDEMDRVRKAVFTDEKRLE